MPLINLLLKNLLLMKNKFLLFALLCFTMISMPVCSQNLHNSWQITLGMGVTKFSNSDADFIGDNNMFQLPAMSLTIPIGKRLSVDGALSINSIDDVGFMSNTARYFSLDGSLRYHFDAVFKKFSPYVFTGLSAVDSDRKISPTINIGAGGIYWVSDKIGINPQLFYKYSLETSESMRSHIQGTLGVVFRLSWMYDSNNRSRRASKSRPSCNYNQFK